MKFNIHTWLGLLLKFIATLQAIKEVMPTRLSGCDGALGMQSRSIKNSQIRASSSLELTPPYLGRLHNKKSVPMLGAWCSRVRDVRQYLRIDLQSVTNITGISSQGLKFSGNNWVSSYTVSYSCDGRLWIPYVIGGQPMIFKGNNDPNTVKRNSLSMPIVARVIRIHPITWNRHRHICMRVELHGCQSNQVCRPTALPTTLPTTALPSTTLRGTSTKNLRTTVPAAMPTTPSCNSSLGMEDRRIKDSQITASSYRTMTLPSAARLNNRHGTYMSYGAWCSQTTDTNQYLQIDLLRTTTIVAIATQGMAILSGHWVSSYTFSYSCNGTDWFLYGDQRERTIFKGNTDSHATVKYHLETPVTTRYVRIRPVAWNKVGYICLRTELYGCLASSQVCTSGNISDPITPTIRATQETHTMEPSLTTPIIHSSVTDTKVHGSQPTNQMKATKHKNRIVIIYKKIEDDEATSLSCQNSSNSLVTLMILLLVLRLV